MDSNGQVSTLLPEGGTLGSDRGGVDSTFTLVAQAAAPQATSGAGTAPPNVTPAGAGSTSQIPTGIAVDEDSRRSAREAREAARRAEKKAKAESKKAEKRARRRARLAVLEDPPKVDKAWGMWVGSAVLIAGVAAFGLRISERTEPRTLVQNVMPGAQQQATTATSQVAKLNPLAGVGRPLHSSAALMIGSYDERGESVSVRLTTGQVNLGAARVEDVAGQLWALGPSDPCTVGLIAPDAKRPIVVEPDAQGKPQGTPLFDCTPPSTTATTMPGATAGK